MSFTNVSNNFSNPYYSPNTAKERFNIGNKVKIGADYSEKSGTIVGFSDEFPYKAQVRLDHSNGGSTTCWIKIEHLTY